MYVFLILRVVIMLMVMLDKGPPTLGQTEPVRDYGSYENPIRLRDGFRSIVVARGPRKANTRHYFPRLRKIL